MLDAFARRAARRRHGRGAARTVFSFVVDADPIYQYQGLVLADSLRLHSGAAPDDVHIHVTPGVPDSFRKLAAGQGHVVHPLRPFGDRTYCNKVAQLDALRSLDFEYAVLLDADTVAVGDLRAAARGGAIRGKPVDGPNPSLAVLAGVAGPLAPGRAAAVVPADDSSGPTYLGYCNGGCYVVPARHLRALRKSWRKNVKRLLASPGPLERDGKTMHIDQIGFWLALIESELPFVPLPTNFNYPLHFGGKWAYFDACQPIELLHVHRCVGATGLVEPACAATDAVTAAVGRANRLIADRYRDEVFWSFRYRHFPELGSGMGSRDANLASKRELLRRHGVEAAETVLDFGCGDLEVLRAFELRGYLGVDRSPEALARARLARPSWGFRRFAGHEDWPTIPGADLVICLEVLIHQRERRDFDRLVDELAARTRRTLIVSGFADGRADDPGRLGHMCFFHAPLADRLRATGRFRSVEAVGDHTTVTVFRCDV